MAAPFFRVMPRPPDSPGSRPPRPRRKPGPEPDLRLDQVLQARALELADRANYRLHLQIMTGIIAATLVATVALFMVCEHDGRLIDSINIYGSMGIGAAVVAAVGWLARLVRAPSTAPRRRRLDD